MKLRRTVMRNHCRRMAEQERDRTRGTKEKGQSMKHLDFIRSLDCAKCGAYGQSVAHHLSGEFHQGGVGRKASDILAMPLCGSCHRAFHDACRVTWKTKEDRLSDQRLWLLQTIITGIERGAIVSNDVKDFSF